MTAAERLAKLRCELSEHYAHGLLLVSWEEEGQTYHAHTRWGNDYAAQQLAARAEEIVFGEDDEEEDE